MASVEEMPVRRALLRVLVPGAAGAARLHVGVVFSRWFRLAVSAAGAVV